MIRMENPQVPHGYTTLIFWAELRIGSGDGSDHKIWMIRKDPHEKGQTAQKNYEKFYVTRYGKRTKIKEIHLVV